MTAATHPPAEARKPRCGPFGELYWDADAGRWVRRLTDEGRDAAGAFLLKHPRPFAVLWKVSPRLARMAVERLDDDELQQIARGAVLTAFTLFDPAAGSSDSSYAALWVRQAVGKRLARKAGEPDHVLSLDGPVAGEAGLDMVSLLPARPEVRPWAAAEWRRVLEPLTAEQRRLVLLRCVDGMSLTAVARRMGLKHDEAWQLMASAHDLIRTHFPDLADAVRRSRHEEG